MLSKASLMILLKSKSFDFEISKPPNVAKFKGIFKLSHFLNIFLFWQDFHFGFLVKSQNKD